MAVCLIFLDRLADAGQNAYLYLEAFTRKIIALILGRVKYFFAQFGKFKIETIFMYNAFSYYQFCKTKLNCKRSKK